MIRPLRRRHQLMVTTLAAVVPFLFIIGLMVRQPMPVMEAVPPATPAFTQMLSSHDDLWGKLNIQTWLLADARPASRLAVELQPVDYMKVPDLLVYWHPGTTSVDQLPENGFLLGTLAGTRAQTYALPDTTLRINGTLTLYSLAHQEIVGTAALSTRQP